jgi:hypothetical protein
MIKVIRKSILYGIAILATASVAVINVNLNSQPQTNRSSVTLKKIEALTSETTEWGCGGNPNHIPNETLRQKTCIPLISYRLKCDYETAVCCDPTKQTSCSGHNPF